MEGKKEDTIHFTKRKRNGRPKYVTKEEKAEQNIRKKEKKEEEAILLVLFL